MRSFRTAKIAVLSILFLITISGSLFAQPPAQQPAQQPPPPPDKRAPLATEVWLPEPKVVTPGIGAAPPSDAIVLFDGKDLSKWQQKDGAPPKWEVKDGAFTVVRKAGAIYSKQSFSDVQLHIEWRAPAKVEGASQGRGNSGIFLQSFYELQVLDSYNNRTYSNGQAGSIYKQHIPQVNASKPPGEWQAYDVAYTAPRFNTDGSVKSPARITVFHNGVLVLNGVELFGPTEYIGSPAYRKHGEKEPLMLQDHTNPVSYRNIWVRELAPMKKVLVFSKTKGFRHDSIPAGNALVLKLGKQHNFEVDLTEDSAQFTAEKLEPYSAVIFNNTTGDVLDDAQQAAFEQFIRKGRGFVGIHAATDCEYDWPWYGKLAGAYFKSHPPGLHEAKVLLIDKEHPSTFFFNDVWTHTDEWYNFKSINPEIKVLLKLDETSYKGGENGGDHPIAWYHAMDGGRAFYTGFGHTKESFDKLIFQRHLLGGILYAISY